jgi:hypothetical protein
LSFSDPVLFLSSSSHRGGLVYGSDRTPPLYKRPAMNKNAVLDFQHVMGNKLLVVVNLYKKCTDHETYPLEDLKLMRRYSWKIHQALKKIIATMEE